MIKYEFITNFDFVKQIKSFIMKKAILFYGAILFANLGFSQWSPTGTLLTDNKFRSGAIGIGYTTAPTFGTNKFMVSGNSYFSGNLGLVNGQLLIGSTTAASTVQYGFNSSKGILVRNNNLTDEASVDVTRNGFPNVAQLAIAGCNGCYAFNAVPGDAVFRGNTAGSMIMANHRNGMIKFETGNHTDPSSVKIQMMIDNIGNVGIGTGSTPLAANEKLAVNGLIHTKEVKVDLLNWPDYVFEKEYDLPSLEEVEKQIQVNGHLANIPSAKEVEENGVLLGEMNKKLLEKVEELTLYIIQMNKEIELLKTQVNK
jgi:hypothetical protein